MDNIKKIGLTALAGYLVAVSAANAGSLSVSGGAKFGYAASDGNEDLETDGNRFGMQKSISFSGTGELDNGNTISLTHNMAAGSTLSTSVLTYDMGDMGALTYSEDSGDVGIGKIDDLMPTAEEEVWNGLDADAHTSSNEAAGENPNGLEISVFGSRDGSANFLDGIVHEVAFWSKGLSAGEIADVNSYLTEIHGL